MENTDLKSPIQQGTGIILDAPLHDCFRPLRRNALADFSTFELYCDAPTRIGRYPWLPCEVEVTGRRVRYNVPRLSGVALVRVRVTFISDGGENETALGWADTQRLWSGYGRLSNGSDLDVCLSD